MAMQECGVLTPLDGGAEEEWNEVLRRPIKEYGEMDGGMKRLQAAKRKREEEDLRDIRQFLRWFDGSQHAEIRRVAGMVPDQAFGATAAVVGVGGQVAKEEDFLERLKKRHARAGAGDDARLQGTVLGQRAEARGVMVEGGPVQHLREWRPKVQRLDGGKEGQGGDGRDDVGLSTEAAAT